MEDAIQVGSAPARIAERILHREDGMNETQTSILADPSIHRFAIKTVVIAVAFVASAWILLSVLDDIVETRVKEIPAAAEVGGKVFLNQLEENIVRAADPSNDLSPERKARLLAAVRILADRWRPFLAEMTTEAGRSPTTPNSGSRD